MAQLKHNAFYRTPDGRRFRARGERRRLDGGVVWSFVPPVVESGQYETLREVLGHYLFLEKGKIVYFKFSAVGPAVFETKWTIHDLVRE